LNTVKNKKQKKNYTNKLTRSYKVVVSSEDTFEERLSFSTNKFNVFLILSLYSIILIAFTISVVFFTQIREMVPGYSSSDLLTQAIYLTKKTDSLENELELNNTFYKSIENVLSGKTEQIIYKDTLALSNEKDNIDFQAVLTNAEDSILRKYVEEEDKFNLSLSQSEKDYRILIQDSLLEYSKIWKKFHKIWHLKSTNFDNTILWKSQQENEMIKLKGSGLRGNNLSDFIRMIQTSIPQQSLSFINSDTTVEINQDRRINFLKTNKYYF